MLAGSVVALVVARCEEHEGSRGMSVRSASRGRGCVRCLLLAIRKR